MFLELRLPLGGCHPSNPLATILGAPALQNPVLVGCRRPFPPAKTNTDYKPKASYV
jgi:hypothetical protein